MEKSESIKNIAVALGVFNKECTKIAKDSKNPFFKSKYASLTSVLSAISEPLEKAGLSFTQIPDGESLCTILMHQSGEYFQSCYTLKPEKNTPQGWGSAITYARRYALVSILGLNVDDDDGNEASKANKKPIGTPKVVNKPVFNSRHAKWNDAINNLAKGKSSLEQIHKYYDMNEQVEKQLLSEVSKISKNV